MEKLPIYISIIFIVTVFFGVYLFWKASGYSKKVIIMIGIWLLVQLQLGLTGFYKTTDTVPPRLLVMILPAILTIIILFTNSAGKRFIDGLDLKILTLMNVIRIPVEIVLLWLFIYKSIPEVMTFEGKNFDIFSGITAPLIYYFGFVKQKMAHKFILIWNIICLALVVNVMMHGILSAPSAFQKLSFDQPNIGILYFPYVWLPAVVVPLVIFSHLVAIRRLLKERNHKKVSSLLIWIKK